MATTALMMASRTQEREVTKMARERMVTRTINSMIYSVMVVDMATKTVETVEVKLASAKGSKTC